MAPVYYNSETKEAQKYRRCFRVEAENPLNGAPSIAFHEEDVVMMGDQPVAKNMVGGGVRVTGIEGPDIQPLDGEGNKVGPAVPRVYLYALLNGLYTQEREARDAADIRANDQRAIEAPKV